jgi:hypothetical protein
VCEDAVALGDESEGEGEREGQQNIFANGGGFEHEEKLGGGFVLLWSVAKVTHTHTYAYTYTYTYTYTYVHTYTYR